MKPTGTVIGLMSGTSGDGVDAALVDISGVAAGEMVVQTRAYLTLPYDNAFRTRLFRLFDPGTATVDEICRCHFLLGEEFARAVSAVCAAAGISPAQVDLVGSHGQTIYHLPPQSPETNGVPSTLQIGSAAVIAERTGITTVSDFRTRDMAAGGEGAPLVPYVDFCLFADAASARAVQNIGGIGNVTALPPGCTPERVLAFDTGPGNMVIDALAQQLLQQAADWDGAAAAAGIPDVQLLQELLTHPYYSLPPPKSTGRELFGRQYAAWLAQVGARRGLSTNDIIATATALTAWSIRDQYARFVVPHMGWPDVVIIGGGGAHNPTLMRFLQECLPHGKVQTHLDYGISGDAKEAIAFAILAWRTWWMQPGNLPSATGAAHPVVLGCITPGAQMPA